ncbi:MAG TPA: hypothetical protein VNL77_18790 [Roseiflexaceae bacterium]|nr:hypothetical protein [Roseiflexaceae bacterium]
MASLTPVKPARRPHIGLYSVGLRAYWDQFPGLRERLIGYGQFIERRLAAWGEVHNFGLVDTEGAGRQAGEWLQARNVDLVLARGPGQARGGPGHIRHQRRLAIRPDSPGGRPRSRWCGRARWPRRRSGWCARSTWTRCATTTTVRRARRTNASRPASSSATRC